MADVDTDASALTRFISDRTDLERKLIEKKEAEVKRRETETEQKRTKNELTLEHSVHFDFA